MPEVNKHNQVAEMELINIKLKLNSRIRLPVKRHHYSVIGYFDQLSINRKSLYILKIKLQNLYGFVHACLCILGFSRFVLQSIDLYGSV